jgi:hypothetical protein
MRKWWDGTDRQKQKFWGKNPLGYWNKFFSGFIRTYLFY